MTTLNEGMLVEHIARPQWGPGKVIHISGDHIHVIFRDQETTPHMALQMATGLELLRPAAQQSDSVLDNLPPLIQKLIDGRTRWVLPAERYALASLKQKFLHEFPVAFNDPKYHAGERDLKLSAHIEFRKQLAPEIIRTLLAESKIEEVVRRAFRAVQQLHMPMLASFEHAALYDGLKDAVAARNFFEAMLAVLSEEPVQQETFEVYLDSLFALPAKGHKVACWPVATLFLYLAAPGRFMFLKPQVTQNAAGALGFDLKYETTPNWTTFQALQRMGQVYLDKLSDMGARDFVDVQSFIYVACGGYDNARDQKAKKAARASASDSNEKGTTTEPGYENKKGQVVERKTDLPGTDHCQTVYELKCLKCGLRYGANGSDIWQRKCPGCGDGAEGISLENA